MNNVKQSPTALLVGDSPFATTGFGRVMKHLANALLANNVEVHLCAVHDNGNPRPQPPWVSGMGEMDWERLFIWSCLSEAECPQRVVEAAQGSQPDLIVLFSDVAVCGQWAQALAQASPADGSGVRKIPVPVLCYFPVDGGGMVPELVEWMNRDWFSTLRVATYTRWGKAQFETAAKRLFGHSGSPFGECAVLPHAADTDIFYPQDKGACRKRLGLEESVGDGFILLNANTNSPRKNLDLTIAGFARFLAQTPDAVGARLWMHCNPRGTWDIPALMKRECQNMGIADWESHLILSQDRVNELHAGTDAAMATIYNAADAGISTSGGEGWGLTSWEHAACRRPQIVVDYAAHGEIFAATDAWKLEPTLFRTAASHLQVHAMVDSHRVAERIGRCYDEWRLGSTYFAENGYQAATAISWEQVESDFYELCWETMVAGGRAL